MPVVTLLAAAEASAQAPPQQAGGTPPAPRWPIALRITVPPASLAARFFGTNAALALPNASTSVGVGEQSRDAYGAVSRRAFRVEPGAGAELVVEVGLFDLDLDREGWFAWVEHDVVLRDGAAKVARWRVRGEGRVQGLGEAAVPVAFRRAAEYAAATFEAELVTDPRVAAWLSSLGIAAGPADRVVARAPPRLTPTEVPVLAPRSARLWFADAGVSVVQAGGFLMTGPSIRAGWTAETLVLQVSVDWWQRSFVARPADAWGSGDGALGTLALGFDAGAWRRLGSRLEIQAGAGPQVLVGFADATYAPLADPSARAERSATRTAIAAGAFGAVRMNGIVPWTGIRYRAGLEVRGRVGGALDVPAVGRRLAGPGLSGGLFVGLELPRAGAAAADP